MKYKHIIFDIDGMLLDTEYAVLHSLQDTIIQYLHRKNSLKPIQKMYQGSHIQDYFDTFLF